jgi:hypothetical protein
VPNEDDPEGGIGRPADAAALLAGLAQEAHEWADALDSLRDDMARPSGRSTLDNSVVAAGVPAAVRSLIGSAESEVLVIEPTGRGGSSWPTDLTPLMLRAAERGNRLRMLFGSRPRDADARAVAQRVEEAGGEVHMAFTPAHPMLTVDQRVALLPAKSEFVIVSQPHVVRVLRSFVDHLWARSSPLIDSAPSAAARDIQERIIALLAAGAKDETVARVLGMSVRTCRRHIAELTTRLHAGSRFQAGVNAARGGMIGTSVDSRIVIQ